MHYYYYHNCNLRIPYCLCWNVNKYLHSYLFCMPWKVLHTLKYKELVSSAPRCSFFQVLRGLSKSCTSSHSSKKNTSIICAQRRFRYAWTLDSLPFEWLNYPLSAKLALWSDWFMSSLGPHDLLILAYGGLFPIINHGKNFRNHIMARGTTSWYQTQLLSVKKYYWLMSWINVHPDFLVTQKIFSENIKYFRKT